MSTAVSQPNPSDPPVLHHSSPPRVSRSQSTRSPRNASGTANSTGGATPHRAASTSHHHSGSRQQQQQQHPQTYRYVPQDVPPHQDYDTAGVAQQYSSSKDRSERPQTLARNDSASTRPHRRDSNRSNTTATTAPSPYVATADMEPRANNTAANNGGPVAAPADGRTAHAAHAAHASHAAHAHGRHSRTRTTIPTQSGKWVLGKTIGAGSMGKVKLAQKEGGDEQVACKIIPRGTPEDGHHSRADRERADQSKEIRTAREAAIVTLLDHPHICGLRDVVRTNYHWYMLFEYVNGGQMLDYIISHGKLKEKQAKKFSRQIASALDYCHRNSVVHRDLKIENILISKTGDIKIIDFGLSNLFSPRGHLKTFCGSLYFAAPELLQARAYTGPEVDIWSFGIVLYVLVCGKVPFDDQSMPALHAKIKKGLVDYPNWLSSECKHLLSRMLVTDPKQRATMQEVMNHPWMIKGYGFPPENHLPHREPLTLPLDDDVINNMTGFNFGPPEVIKAQLTRTIESEDYQRAVRLMQREKELPQPPKDVEKKRGFGFDFYKRRNSMNSRETLTNPSSEVLQIGNDPLNAYSPLISIYYLVREKQERDRLEHPAPAPPPPEKTEKQEKKATGSEMPEIMPPQEAHTNAAAYEMPGEKPTGGRSRPRARTHGEEEAAAAREATKKAHLSPEGPLSPDMPPAAEHHPRKESTAAGILRRFSTRRRAKEPERLDKDRSHPPVVHVHSPADAPATPRKSFSIRRSRRDHEELRSGGSQPQHSELLSPPLSAGANPHSYGSKKGLGRSTSVNSGSEFRRKIAKEPPPTSGSDQSGNERTHGDAKGSLTPRSASTRAKSLGHARRESIQARRRQREGAREANVAEETDQEVVDEGGASGRSDERLDDAELAKPVFLKGLFSVSTTSGKSVPEIRADIKRVLRQLGVDYTEIRGGFSCRHAPSIDLKRAPEPPMSPSGEHAGHRRHFSLGLRGSDRERDEAHDADRDNRLPVTPRTPGGDRGKAAAVDDGSYTNSDLSDEQLPRRGHHQHHESSHRKDRSSERDSGEPSSAAASSSRRAPGETTTHVQSDLGGNMVVEFEIFIVKVPLLSLHGIQFKRMAGNTWHFKNLADQILRELRL